MTLKHPNIVLQESPISGNLTGSACKGSTQRRWTTPDEQAKIATIKPGRKEGWHQNHIRNIRRFTQTFSREGLFPFLQSNQTPVSIDLHLLSYSRSSCLRRPFRLISIHQRTTNNRKSTECFTAINHPSSFQRNILRMFSHKWVYDSPASLRPLAEINNANGNRLKNHYYKPFSVNLSVVCRWYCNGNNIFFPTNHFNVESYTWNFDIFI